MFQEFAFDKQNYLFLFIGIAIIILGFFVMSGGGSDDPNVFKGDYSLNEQSFEKLSNEFMVDPAIVDQLSSLKGKIFPGEQEIKEAMVGVLGQEVLKDNYYQLRSATHIDADIFNTRRLTIAPLIVIFGYAFIMYAILKKKKNPVLVEE